jgi:hypothetical protein
MVEYIEEDVGNIILLEHINVQVPAQTVASLFYITGLGLTRDPYLNVGLQNMWINVGEQQFHLPTRPAQVIDGVIGLVMPEIETLRERLISLEEPLKDTKFSWSSAGEQLEVRGPWGNRFRCHRAGGLFGDMDLGIAYVEFRVPQGTVVPIARFYETVFEAPATVRSVSNGSLTEVKVGRNQSLRFREVQGGVAPYEGYHVAVYVAKLSPAFNFLKSRNLISEDVENHQFRFKELIDPNSGATIYYLEHEVRSLYHPMFGRRFINRNPHQSQRNYRRGQDGLISSRHR